MTAELKKWTRIFTALASIWSNIFTTSNEKRTCLKLCLLCIFKFQTLTCQNFWIFCFSWRLILYECVINVCIQQWFLIQNWTIGKFKVVKNFFFACELLFCCMNDYKVILLFVMWKRLWSIKENIHPIQSRGGFSKLKTVNLFLRQQE